MHDLARVSLVLAPGGHGRWLRATALVAALVTALLAGAAGSHVYWRTQLASWREDTTPMQDFRLAEQALAQTRLQLQVSEAHSRELENQIDGLNQRLRACQEEAAFFRKGREIPR